MDVPVKKKAEPSDVEHASDRPYFVPGVDIYESEEAVTVLASLPGVPKDSVVVTVDEGVLSLTGKVRSDLADDAEGRYCECEVGDFFRSFRLGPGVDGARMEASMSDGILTLVVPKSDWAKTKKIEVK